MYSSSTAMIMLDTTNDVVPCTINSLHLYRHKSGGGKEVYSTTVITTGMFRNTTYDIIPCTLNSLHFYRHKSGGKNGSTVCTAVVQQ